MTAYVALLRGINVSGHNRPPMADLRGLFVDLGHREVATCVQSGNVVFRSERPDIAAGRERATADRFGLAVKVLLRTSVELGELVAGRPFDPAALYVTSLERAPQAERVRALDPEAGAPDRYRLRPREIYLHCRGGYGRTTLHNAFRERRLVVDATTRNWNTFLRLHAISGGG